MSLFFISTANAIDLEHPKDWYYHAGIMTACSSFFMTIFTLESNKNYERFNLGDSRLTLKSDKNYKSFGEKYPRLTTFIVCNTIGLMKEYGFDSQADYRDIIANNAGIGLGLALTFNF
ncbi:MAG: hypothetical protein HYW34_02475 [Candidatus Brennerbacteria bacterium]|nr:hypothetical protein [Candidatus Brennerbacteria bacterium]